MAEVRVYSTLSCGWCKRTKRMLEDNNIAFKELDVAADKSARDEMIKKSGQMGVPVIEIDDQVIVGFNESKIRELLHLPSG